MRLSKPVIDDFTSDPKEELKRADHSIYVTLKYTRTIDVIKNTIKRLITACELATFHTLISLQKNKKISEVPPTPRAQAEQILKALPKLKEYLRLYERLVKIDNAPYTKKEEYRKNVALLAQITPELKEEVNIDLLRQFFHKTAEYVDITQMIRQELTPKIKEPKKKKKK